MRAVIAIVLVMVGTARADEPKPKEPAPPPPAPAPAPAPVPAPTPPPPPTPPTPPSPATSNPFDTFTGSNAQGKQLFEQARQLMKEGNQTAACAKYAESWKQEEAISTHLNLARCRENESKYGEAYRMFQDAARRSRDAGVEDRAKIASDAAAALEPKLATVVIRLAAPIAQGTTVTVNDRLVDTAPEIRDYVDPGTVTVVARGPTGVTSTKTFRIFTQNAMRVDVPTLQERTAGRQPVWIAASAVMVGGGIIALGAGSGGVKLVGGVAVAGGVALFLLAPRRRITVVPALVSNESGGVAMALRF